MNNTTSLLKTLYSIPANQTNCSGFIKSVALTLDPTRGLGLNGSADAMIVDIAGHWVLVGKGSEGGPQAAACASQGYLVIALLKAEDHLKFKFNPATKAFDIPHMYIHGHVAIVLSGPTKEGYPYLICGSIAPDGSGRSDGSQTVNHKVWRAVDAPKVQYYRTSNTFAALSNTNPAK